MFEHPRPNSAGKSLYCFFNLSLKIDVYNVKLYSLVKSSVIP